jgi:hypothetical protein
LPSTIQHFVLVSSIGVTRTKKLPYKWALIYYFDSLNLLLMSICGALFCVQSRTWSYTSLSIIVENRRCHMCIVICTGAYYMPWTLVNKWLIVKWLCPLWQVQTKLWEMIELGNMELL